MKTKKHFAWVYIRDQFRPIKNRTAITEGKCKGMMLVELYDGTKKTVPLSAIRTWTGQP